MVGLSVVSQTLCKMVVFPAFALPMMRTRNWIFGIGRQDCSAAGRDGLLPIGLVSVQVGAMSMRLLAGPPDPAVLAPHRYSDIPSAKTLFTLCLFVWRDDV